MPLNYTPGAIYNGSSAVQKGDPLFVNYPLPVTGRFKLRDITTIGNYKFTLKASSPCIGKGFTGFVPLKTVKEDAIYGATEITQPGKNIGCYQTSGTGNQHFL